MSSLNYLSIQTELDAIHRRLTAVEEQIYEEAAEPIHDGAALKIRTIVAEHFGVFPDTLMRGNRQNNFVVPRHVTIYLIRTLLGFSQPRIGKLFNINHTSVLYAERNIKRKIKKDAKLKWHVSKLSHICREKVLN